MSIKVFWIKVSADSIAKIIVTRVLAMRGRIFPRSFLITRNSDIDRRVLAKNSDP